MLWKLLRHFVNYRFLPVRCYASASISHRRFVVCLSVCPSHAGIVSKWLPGLRWCFAYRFPSTHAMLYCRKIRVSPEIRILPSGTLSQTLDFICHGTQMVGECDVNCDSRQTGVYGTSGGDSPTADVHGTYDMAQTPLVRFLVNLLYTKSNQWSLSLYSQRRLPTLGVQL